MPPAERPGERRAPPWILIGTAVGALVIVVGAFVLTRGGDDDDTPPSSVPGSVTLESTPGLDARPTEPTTTRPDDDCGADHGRPDHGRPRPRSAATRAADAAADTTADAATARPTPRDTAAHPTRDLSTAMPIDLDDDDTTPTENAAVLRDLAATLAAFPLGVVEWGAATSPGTRRRVNEDTWGRRDDVFAVADGMGGRGGGALAARTAVDRLLDRVGAAGAHPDWRAIVERVNADVIAVAAERGIERVGTTLARGGRRRARW